jgi:hypothetical protein
MNLIKLKKNQGFLSFSFVTFFVKLTVVYIDYK